MKSLLLSLMFLVGCGNGLSDKEILKNVKYVQDKRTGLCFAVTQNSPCGPIYSSVACEKVGALISNPWSR